IIGSGLRTRARQQKPSTPVETPAVAREESGTPTSRELWVSIFPVGVRIYGLWRDVSDPNTVYAATHRGLYKSTDGGMYWFPIFSREAEWLTFAQSKSSPSVLYLGLGGQQGRLWKSANGGQNWNEVGSGS